MLGTWVHSYNGQQGLKLMILSFPRVLTLSPNIHGKLDSCILFRNLFVSMLAFVKYQESSIPWEYNLWISSHRLVESGYFTDPNEHRRRGWSPQVTFRRGSCRFCHLLLLIQHGAVRWTHQKRLLIFMNVNLLFSKFFAGKSYAHSYIGLLDFAIWSVNLTVSMSLLATQ